MKIAEKLYTQGYISYPRTETNIFPRELNLAPLVEQQCGDGQWGPFAQRILNDGGPNPRQGRKSDQVNDFNFQNLNYFLYYIFIIGPSSYTSNKICKQSNGK